MNFLEDLGITFPRDTKFDKEHPALTDNNEEPQQAKLPGRQRAEGSLVIWKTVRKHWATAIATLIVVTVGTVFYTLGQKKTYEAQSTILFDPNPARPLGRRVENVVEMGAPGHWLNQEYYETQYHLIRSRRVALSVVNELGLNNDPRFIQNLPYGAEPKKGERTSAELASEILRGRLEVQPVRDSRLAVVKLRDASPQRAQRVLAAVVDAYVAQNLDNALQTTSSATDWLRNQLDSLKGDLNTREIALHAYKKNNDILSVAFDDKSNMLTSEMSTINTELTHVRARIQEAAARKAVLAKVRADDPNIIQSSELLKSSLLNSLRIQFEGAVRDRDALTGSGKGENHPAVAAANRRIARARKSILNEIHNVKRAAKRDVAVLSRQAGGLKAMLEKAKKQAHGHNLLEIEYNRLRRSKENTEKLYSLVLERTKEADLTQMLRVNNISVVDRPLLPRTAVFPRVPLNIAFGVFAGMLLGIAAAFARGLMDRTLKVPEDLERDLGVTFLGLLPELARGSKPAGYNNRKRQHGQRIVDGAPELIVHDEPTSSIAEASRAIRTNLMFMAPDNPYRTLLVTSAGPSDGKTTVACCIAVAMAQAGQSVLLIDCDLRRPRIHRIFKGGTDAGVTTILLEGNFDEAVNETCVPNLSVITSGPVPPNPAELFHTDKFKQLLAEATKRFDRVILDSPPVAAVTDPTIVSTLVDGTVLVARAFSTRKDLARHALRSIEDVGGKMAGAVLNAVDFSRLEYKYSHYNYYGREGYTYGDGASRPAPSTRGEALLLPSGEPEEPPQRASIS